VRGTWEALVRPARRLRASERLGPVELVEALGGGRWLVRLEGEPEGEPPLPPYIHGRLDDPERYQTVYAREPRSAAAPTAGLHLTSGLLARLDPVSVTLHVGVDTFRPVKTSRVEDPSSTGAVRRGPRRGAASPPPGGCSRGDDDGADARVRRTDRRALGRTRLFIVPGFEFLRVDALLTNFTFRSTLLALVMAFVGVEETQGSTARRSRSAIASTRSATQWWPCDRAPRARLFRHDPVSHAPTLPQ
jgi:S-adenosylmethionine:tRNA ribosyltransferase-isomerase